jgi:hypothetical protein
MRPSRTSLGDGTLLETGPSLRLARACAARERAKTVFQHLEPDDLASSNGRDDNEKVPITLPVRLTRDASDPRITTRVSLARMSSIARRMRSILLAVSARKEGIAGLPDCLPIHGKADSSSEMSHVMFSAKSSATWATGSTACWRSPGS